MLVSIIWKKPDIPDFEINEYWVKNILNFCIDEY
jgi:hypothetical protein